MGLRGDSQAPIFYRQAERLGVGQGHICPQSLNSTESAFCPRGSESKELSSVGAHEGCRALAGNTSPMRRERRQNKD